MLTRLYGPLIYSWARKSGLTSEDAADVLQNVFVSVWRGLPAFTADRPESSFRGWLRVITRNAVREWARRGETLILAQAAMERVADPGMSADADIGMAEGADDLFSNLTNRALAMVRSTVDERTWSAFWKSTMDDIPVADVAAQLELSPAAVRQAKYRVLCRLRELLADR
ncbi:MAG: sigma-70 family RNA polymerase sigma factor [Planctomycetaceae bacterium]|nr:sigma-70 family RNA polymerase sigma factor [Planctomycetaceae bacterium]